MEALQQLQATLQAALQMIGESAACEPSSYAGKLKIIFFNLQQEFYRVVADEREIIASNFRWKRKATRWMEKEPSLSEFISKLEKQFTVQYGFQPEVVRGILEGKNEVEAYIIKKSKDTGSSIKYSWKLVYYTLEEVRNRRFGIKR